MNAPLEIERRFMLAWPIAEIIAEYPGFGSCAEIEQAYFVDTGGWAIRVRKTAMPYAEPSYEMTMKRFVSEGTCIEIPHTIDARTYEACLAWSGPAIRKRRWTIFTGDTWEIDEFLNPELEGLILAEIELPALDAPFEAVDWIGCEVTSDRRYSNASLAGRLA